MVCFHAAVDIWLIVHSQCVHFALLVSVLSNCVFYLHFQSLAHPGKVVVCAFIIITNITRVLSSVNFYSQVELTVGVIGQASAPLTTFLCPSSSHQALLRGDDTSGLFHPASAAGRQHGRHLPGAPLSAGH